MLTAGALAPGHLVSPRSLYSASEEGGNGRELVLVEAVEHREQAIDSGALERGRGTGDGVRP